MSFHIVPKHLCVLASQSGGSNFLTALNAGEQTFAGPAEDSRTVSIAKQGSALLSTGKGMEEVKFEKGGWSVRRQANEAGGDLLRCCDGRGSFAFPHALGRCL